MTSGGRSAEASTMPGVIFGAGLSPELFRGNSDFGSLQLYLHIVRNTGW